jgi:hypothetical protein
VGKAKVKDIVREGHTVSSMELADLMEGDACDMLLKADRQFAAGQREQPGLQVLSSMGEPLDSGKFRQLYNQAVKATRSETCLNHFRETGKFSREALAAVEKLQKFVRKGEKPLPTPDELYRDKLSAEGNPSRAPLGEDYERWSSELTISPQKTGDEA